MLHGNIIIGINARILTTENILLHSLCTSLYIVCSPQQLFFLVISYIKTKDDGCLEVEDKVVVAQYKEAYLIIVLN
jgi:hypothetical protein